MTAAPFYRKTLDAGTYVVCADSNNCVEKSVEAGLVTTVNIVNGSGLVAFMVSDASGHIVRESAISRSATF
jgi:hypothetical protein